MTLLQYLEERETKSKLLIKRNLQQQTHEKNLILDDLPDGAIIFKEATDTKELRIRYVNQTFMKMFPLNDEAEAYMSQMRQPNRENFCKEGGE